MICAKKVTKLPPLTVDVSLFFFNGSIVATLEISFSAKKKKINLKIIEVGFVMISAHNFSEHVFSWYVKQGKQGRLLLATGRSHELGRYAHLYT